MKITTKTIYAIRAVHSLNVLSGDTASPVSVEKISERLGISNKYLEQIFSTLKKNGIVRSAPGKNGGYFLSKKPEEISALDIIVVMDGPFTPVHCINNRDCSVCSECSVNWLWNSMKENCEGYLASVKISDLSDGRFPVVGCQ